MLSDAAGVMERRGAKDDRAALFDLRASGRDLPRQDHGLRGERIGSPDPRASAYPLPHLPADVPCPRDGRGARRARGDHRGVQSGGRRGCGSGDAGCISSARATGCCRRSNEAAPMTLTSLQQRESGRRGAAERRGRDARRAPRQALRRRDRAGRRHARHYARRDPRDHRRERRRQIDADAHPVGLYRPDEGQMFVEGAPVAFATPDAGATRPASRWFTRKSCWPMR